MDFTGIKCSPAPEDIDDSYVVEKVLAEENEKARTITLIRARSFDPTPSSRQSFSVDKDIRLKLFESAHPYPHPKDFQRVIITEAGESLDDDTIESCQALDACIKLRQKWISAHPQPPQDNIVVEFTNRTSYDFGQPVDPKALRRRADYEYDIFNRPVPQDTDMYTYSMVGGVVQVQEKENNHHNDTDSSNSQSDLNTSKNRFSVLSFDEFVEDFVFVSLDRHDVINSLIWSFC